MYPIIPEHPRISPDGGWRTSHVGVWAAVQRPRKAGLDGRGLKLGRRVRRVMGFPRKKFQLHPNALSRGLHPRECFRGSLGDGSSWFATSEMGGDPFLLLLSFASSWRSVLLPPPLHAYSPLWERGITCNRSKVFLLRTYCKYLL